MPAKKRSFKERCLVDLDTIIFRIFSIFALFRADIRLMGGREIVKQCKISFEKRPSVEPIKYR